MDLQGQVNWIYSDFGVSTGSLADERVSKAFAISMEAGQRLYTGANSAIVPQAQLVLGQVLSSNFTDSRGNAVDIGTVETAVARLGVAYEHEFEKARLHVIANVLHDFSNDSQVKVGAATLNASTAQTWAEIGAGGTMTLTSNAKLYGEGSYRAAINGPDGEAYGGNVGLRINW